MTRMPACWDFLPRLEARAIRRERRAADDARDARPAETRADEKVSVYEHCARGLDSSLTHGAHGLPPLIGTGDWNDGMNAVGEAGRGESSWLAWFAISATRMFDAIARRRAAKSRRANAGAFCTTQSMRARWSRIIAPATLASASSTVRRAWSEFSQRHMASLPRW
ncbi:MAG: hypothetical protein WDW38_009184 [Sanguina aurantia]